ncbi:hypothetical protein [Paracoccus shandongensis]|uniref:hypothetical protein n=1 Tax=Paracoccus shandongensis TaxID=2816048 RepID=UPI001A8CE432|nr:hypothetical protein [Paracoccus shandongensis]
MKHVTHPEVNGLFWINMAISARCWRASRSPPWRPGFYTKLGLGFLVATLSLQILIGGARPFRSSGVHLAVGVLWLLRAHLPQDPLLALSLGTGLSYLLVAGFAAAFEPGRWRREGSREAGRTGKMPFDPLAWARTA